MSASASSSGGAAAAASCAAAAAGSPAASLALPTAADADRWISERRFDELLQAAQRREQEAGGVFNRDSELWFAMQLFAALLADKPLSAKWVWKRVPAELKKGSGDLQLTWKVVSSLLQRDFEAFFASSASVAGALSLPALQRLNELLRAEVQSRNLVALCQAYAVVSAEQAAPLLGLTREQAGPFLLARAWTADAEAAGFFVAPPLVDSKPREVSQQQIEQLTKYVTHLED